MAINPLGLSPPLLLCALIGRRWDPGPDKAARRPLPLCSPPSSPPLLHHLLCSMMTGREELSEEKPRVKLLSPGFGIDKSRLHGPGLRSKGFAITDLLGLETDLQARQQPGGAPFASGPGTEQHGAGPGLGGFSFPGGSLPLGLGFLCSLAAQQPAGAPCFLPGHLPLLQARPDSHYLQNLEVQREAYSGTETGWKKGP